MNVGLVIVGIDDVIRGAIPNELNINHQSDDEHTELHLDMSSIEGIRDAENHDTTEVRES
jgi:hypothetical protein